MPSNPLNFNLFYCSFGHNFMSFWYEPTNIVKLSPRNDLFKEKLSLSCFWKLLFQVSFKHRNCNSTEEASNIKLIFWGSNKNRHSTKCLKLMKIKWKIISDQVFAKKRYGTYFFWHAKIPNFSLKTCWFLRILGSYEHKVTRRPILHPQAPTWPTGT